MLPMTVESAVPYFDTAMKLIANAMQDAAALADWDATAPPTAVARDDDDPDDHDGWAPIRRRSRPPPPPVAAIA